MDNASAKEPNTTPAPKESVTVTVETIKTAEEVTATTDITEKIALEYGDDVRSEQGKTGLIYSVRDATN